MLNKPNYKNTMILYSILMLKLWNKEGIPVSETTRRLDIQIML